MSTLTSKVVSFNIYAGHDLHKYQGAKASHMEPLDRALAGLTESVRKFVDGYHYLRARIITCQSSTFAPLWWDTPLTFPCFAATAVAVDHP
jgi:hypothetical protein